MIGFGATACIMITNGDAAMRECKMSLIMIILIVLLLEELPTMLRLKVLFCILQQVIDWHIVTLHMGIWFSLKFHYYCILRICYIGYFMVDTLDRKRDHDHVSLFKFFPLSYFPLVPNNFLYEIPWWYMSFE